MTDHGDTRVRQLVCELVEASPPAPAFNDLAIQPRPPLLRRRRRVLVGTASVVLVLAGVVGGIAIATHEDPSSGPPLSVRVANPPLLNLVPPYVDVSKPPPLRVMAGGHTVDVTTVLGCWFHVPGDAAGHGVGVCADGAVDPSRFRLTVRAGSRVVLRLPIAANISAKLGDAPPHPLPHALAMPVTNQRALELRRDGPDRWSFAFPGGTHDLALIIDLKANATAGRVRVSGDAYYGLTLATGR